MALMRIPMNSDTQSEIIGHRSGIVGQLSERSDALERLLKGCPNWVKFFLLPKPLFFGAKRRVPPHVFGVRRFL